jgi:hypothetical protein
VLPQKAGNGLLQGSFNETEVAILMQSGTFLAIKNRDRSSGCPDRDFILFHKKTYFIIPPAAAHH